MISALALTVCLALGMTTGSFASPVSEEGAAYTTGVASVDQHMDAAAKARAKAARASKKDGKMKKDQWCSRFPQLSVYSDSSFSVTKSWLL